MSRTRKPPRLDHLGRRPRRTALGNPYIDPRPEAGPTAAVYFARKAACGQHGQHDVLHEIARRPRGHNR